MHHSITHQAHHNDQQKPRLNLIQSANHLSEIVPDTVFLATPFAKEDGELVGA